MFRDLVARPAAIILMVVILGLTGCSSFLSTAYRGHARGDGPGVFLPPILY